MKTAIFILLMTVSSYAGGQPWDVAHFENGINADVLVYLLDRSGKHCAVFGVGSGGVNNVDLRPSTTALVTLVPKGKEGHVILLPEGKQIAKSKLQVPQRTRADRNDRDLFYRIADGRVQFVSSRSRKGRERNSVGR